MFNLKYGNLELKAAPPPGWRTAVLAPPEMRPVEDPAARLEALLDRPAGSPPFDAIFAEKKSVAVIAPDITRKAGVSLLLPALMGRLERLGLGPDKAVILFATGIHPAQDEAKKMSIVGEGIYRRYRCVDHNARGPCIKRGGVYINPHVATADAIVIMGGVKLHYLAGFGGGRKAILPGVAFSNECLRFHELSLDPAGPGRDPGVGPGKLENNPMHLRAMEAARAVGVDFLVNTVMDDKGKMVFLNAGDLDQSYAQACAFALRAQTAPLERAADAVIVSAGGHPGDINFIQAHKALDAACAAARPGAPVFLAAECGAGMGNSTFLSWFKHGASGEMERALRRKFEINGQTAFATREKAERNPVFLLSSLPPDDVRLMGLTPVAGVEEGVRRCAEIAGESAFAAVIPDGGAVYPALP